jgi:hypothetical protein
LLDELDVGLDFGALVARVPVFVDVQRLRQTSRGLEASRNPEFAQSARKLLASDRSLDRHTAILDSFRRTPSLHNTHINCFILWIYLWMQYNCNTI